jgi:hypothetical protein
MVIYLSYRGEYFEFSHVPYHMISIYMNLIFRKILLRSRQQQGIPMLYLSSIFLVGYRDIQVPQANCLEHSLAVEGH